MGLMGAFAKVKGFADKVDSKISSMQSGTMDSDRPGSRSCATCGNHIYDGDDYYWRGIKGSGLLEAIASAGPTIKDGQGEVHKSALPSPLFCCPECYEKKYGK